MRAILIALAAFAGACAYAQTSALTPIAGTSLRGDFDGDGRLDSAGFFEDTEGHLLVVITRAAARDPDTLWGGDIASFEAFAIRHARAGLYTTDCEAYGPDCGGEPRDVRLSHDGLIVREVAVNRDLLYYWDGSAFQNVLIAR